MNTSRAAGSTVVSRIAAPTQVGPASRAVNRALSVAAVVVVFAVWWLAGAQTRFIPPVGDVLSRLPEFLARPEVPAAVAATTVRVVGSLAIALVLGLGCALVMTRGGFVARILRSFVNFSMAFPSTIAALLALYIFQRSPVSVYVVVAFITFPFAATVIEQGLREIDLRLNEMSRVYRYRRSTVLRQVTVPQIVPYFFAALRNEHAHAWKVVVLAELFAVNSGMGWQFSRAFDRFLLEEVLLWLLLFMTILLTAEYAVVRPLERFAVRWRKG